MRAKKKRSRPAAQAERFRGTAEAVRRRRREMNLTQVELARFAGVGPDFVYDVEDGKPSVRFDKLLDVLCVLGLELRLVAGKGSLVVDGALATPPEEGAAP